VKREPQAKLVQLELLERLELQVKRVLLVKQEPQEKRVLLVKRVLPVPPVQRVQDYSLALFM
jgi:hypothetical protein